MATLPKSLLIFRRDLRLHDNTALLAAHSRGKSVVPCFIFTDEQTGANPYRSLNGFAFLIETLRELSEEIASKGGQLYLFHGKPDEVVSALQAVGAIDSIFLNKDYTPFSRRRDQMVVERCQAPEGAAVPFHSLSDALLIEPSSFGKPTGGPYTVFTPFFKKASLNEIRRPISLPEDIRWGKLDEKLLTGVLAPTHLGRYEELLRDAGGAAPERRSVGGRKAALAALERIPHLAQYGTERDFPALSGTSILAPHNKFGTVSIREVYWRAADAFGTGHPFIRELFWRDFFTHIAWHFPHVFSGAFNKRYDAIAWEDNADLFEAWCTGKTGFPIVDAGMRELVATGYMHNRVRMIVASFLTKDLHISWRQGESFFARHLTEYDPAVNNGSWQWAASTGCDAQPYFRIFNPWLQQQKFDNHAVYIKRWIPELAGCSPREIHALHEKIARRPNGYPAPIVEHAIAKSRAEQLFRELAE